MISITQHKENKLNTKVWILLIALVTFHYSCQHKENNQMINLDFEQINPKSKMPINWYFGSNSSYRITIDSNIVFNGKYSLKIENSNESGKKDAGIGGLLYITDVPNGDTIRLSGYIKTENTTHDSIGLNIGYQNSNGDFIKILNDSALIGTNDWTEYTIDLVMGDNPNFYVIGVYFNGEGEIWIDNLKLYIDNNQVINIPPPSEFIANKKEIRWLKTHSIPIKTYQPNSGFEDFESLKGLIGDARIVGLGENTHGSSEIFKLKHRLVEFLVTELGFTILSIEANMPETYKLNDYVLNGIGDPKELLRGTHFWIYNTKEVLDMIEWMRTFNSSGKGKIQFTGFDMQYIQGAIEYLSNFSKMHDIKLRAKVDSLSLSLQKFRSKRDQYDKNDPDLDLIINKCQDIVSYIVNNKQYLLKSISETDFQWLLQNARIALQSCEPDLRDQSMAQNIDWILENNPNSKIILWAHNGHINKKQNRMGRFLSDKYHDDYYNIGFLSYQGKYTAMSNGKLSSNNTLEKPKPGSFEYSFNKTGRNIFYFDFYQVTEEDQSCQWLLKIHNCRDIGATARKNQFIPTDINEDYNAIVFIKNTTPSDCFDVK